MGDSSDDKIWKSLKTISKFDGSINENTFENSNTSTKKIVPNNDFTKTILIETLIRGVCGLLESDPKNQSHLYKLVCDKLFELNLIEKNYEIEALDSLRNLYTKSLFDLFATFRAGRNFQNSIEWHKTDIKLINLDKIITSRYNEEFTQLNFIAKGGFGKVFKVRHKLDGEEYAMKKIFIKYLNKNNFLYTIQEVRTLAKLNHPNIVSYKGAWYELADPSMLSSSSSSSSSSSCSSVTPSATTSSKESSPDEDLSEEESSSLKLNKIKMKKSHQENIIIMYIQMQLCNQTLREWINLRNANKTLDISINDSIFIQICKGVEYIHAQNIVHHDLKPSNIFIDFSHNNIQVGDFGLACMLNKDIDFQGVHDDKVGTPLYSAPEQLRGNCDFKSDIYTLGIILFELYQIFQTDMERYKLIDNLKKKLEFPEEFKNYKFCQELIENLIQDKAENRPTARAILFSLAFNNSTHEKDQEIKNLHDVISEKDQSIKNLKDRISEQEEIIKALNEKLAQLESKC